MSSSIFIYPTRFPYVSDGCCCLRSMEQAVDGLLMGESAEVAF